MKAKIPRLEAARLFQAAEYLLSFRRLGGACGSEVRPAATLRTCDPFTDAEIVFAAEFLRRMGFIAGPLHSRECSRLERD